MKTRKILFGTVAIVLGMVILSSFTMNKADLHKLFQRKPETRANVITEIMRNKLAMDDDQFDRAYQINLKYARLSEPYLKDKNSASENKDKLVEINQERKKELQAILTPEQLKLAETIRKQWISRLETLLEQLKDNDLSN
jgi:hypothetical protein